MLELKITANSPNEILQIAGVIAALGAAQQQRLLAAPEPKGDGALTVSEAQERTETVEKQKRTRRTKEQMLAGAAVSGLTAAEHVRASTATTEPHQTDIEDKPEDKKAWTLDTLKDHIVAHGNLIRVKAKKPDAYKEEIYAVLVGAGVKNAEGKPAISAIKPEQFDKVAAIVDALSAAFKTFDGDEAAWAVKRAVVIEGLSA